MRRVALYRVLIIAALLLLLEWLCAAGVIDRITMPPPHTILRDLVAMLASGSLDAAIAKTLGNAATALALALAAGVACAVAIHNYPRVRETLEPLFATYYAIPVFAFYPLLIIVLGLGDAPQIFIGAMLGVVAVIVNTLNGLDRVPAVLRKAAQVHGMGATATALLVTLPCASPYVLTGARLAV